VNEIHRFLDFSARGIGLIFRLSAGSFTAFLALLHLRPGFTLGFALSFWLGFWLGLLPHSPTFLIGSLAFGARKILLPLRALEILLALRALKILRTLEVSISSRIPQLWCLLAFEIVHRPIEA